MRVTALFGFGPGQVRLGALSVRQWIWLLVLASALIQFYIAELSALEFRQQAGDLGIFMQAFSNTGHGRLFWNTQAYLHYGTLSLLNIHFAWPIFAVYPLYVAFPSMTTLFVIQAVVLSVAAVPLSSLTTLVTGSQRKGLIAAGLYLLWAPLYVGMPNSFHLEAFLPVEFFLLVYFWWRREFVWGLIVALITGFTLDVAPVFTALLGVMFLTYPIESFLRGHVAPTTDLLFKPRSGDSSLPPTAFFPRLVTYLRWKPVVAAIVLIGLSAATLLAVRYLEVHFPVWLGVSGPTLGKLRIVGFSPSNVFVNPAEKIEFWVVLLATVGFLPLLYPRILVVLVPWIGYTFAEAAVEWYQLPAHYMAIAAIPLFIGVAFALKRLSFHRGPAPDAYYQGGSHPGSPRAPRTDSLFRFRAATKDSVRSRPVIVVSMTVVLVVVGINVGLNPLNPLTAPIIREDGGTVFTGSGGPYGLTLVPAPGFSEVVALADLLPRDATVLVSDDLYPIVSADPNAWCYNGDFSSQFVPFNSTDLPTYVLTQPSYLANFNQYVYNVSFEGHVFGISSLVWDSAAYGVRGWTQNTPLGPIYLFQQNYTGTPESFGAISYPSIQFYTNATLFVNTTGAVVSRTIPSPTNESSIYSGPFLNGTMWEANDFHHPLPAGEYNLSMEIQSNILNQSQCSALVKTNQIMRLEGNVPTSPFSESISNLTCEQYLNLPHVGSTGWRTWNVTLSFGYPLYQFLFFGKRPINVPNQPEWIATASVLLTPERSG